jgi:O-antigen/teichoic acid export membrane protein
MAAQTVVALATYSYLVRVVGAVQVGAWVSLVAAGMLACVADLGLNHALIRQLSVALHGQHESTGAQALETIETIVATVAGATGIALMLAWLSFSWWGGWISAPAAGIQASQWLGFVLVGLWLNRVAEALAGALDGQQRFVERSLALAAALLCGLALTVAVTPHWGMLGFAVAFVVQNALMVIFFGMQLRNRSPGLRWLRPRIRPSILRDALRYGLSVQLLVMCYLVIESGVKLSLARSGNLAEVAYFDLAFRIGRGVRGLLASALRVLVPRLAPGASDADGAQRRHQTYAKSFAALQLFSLPIFAAIIAGSQVLSMVLVGRHEPAFVAALGASLVAWLGYSLTDPAMNLSLSSGRMRWPVLGHVLTLALVLCALTFGWPSNQGAFTSGLYVQVALAILAGCLTTLTGVHHSEGAGWFLLKPLPTLAALAAAAAVGLFGLRVDTLLPAWTVAGQWAAVAAVLAAYSASLWLLNPAGHQIWGALAPGFMRKASTAGRPAGGS